MKALIDADIFQWEFGSATDDEFKPLSLPLVMSRVQARINGIMEATGSDSYQLYITSDDKSNFRYELATIKPYKGNRPSEKPFWYYQIRDFLIKHREAIEVFGQEADDALGIDQFRDIARKVSLIQEEEYHNTWRHLENLCETVICSRDKDLDMIPGWHYSWGAGKQEEKELWFQDEVGASRCFYKQLLTGDSVDNIPGLYGIGKASIYLKRIDDLTSDCDMYSLVREQYSLRFGSYADQFLLENARLLWIRRKEDELWEPPNIK